MWSKGELKAILEAKALLRRGASSRMEEAALLYARSQGWTEEELDPKQAEANLNALLDSMEPDEWAEMQKAAPLMGDATFKGLLTYAVGRIAARTDQDIEALRKQGDPAPSSRRVERDRG